MIERTRCRECGGMFYPAKPYYHTCRECFFPKPQGRNKLPPRATVYKDWDDFDMILGNFGDWGDH